MATNPVGTNFSAITNAGNSSGGAELAQLRATLNDLFVKVKSLAIRKDLDDDYKKQMLQLYQAEIQLVMKQIEALQSKSNKQPSISLDTSATPTEKSSKTEVSKPGMQAGIDTFA